VRTQLELADRGSLYNCTGILHGNSIFAPVIGVTSLQSLPMLRGVQHCLESVRAHEAAAGWRFGRIVFSPPVLVAAAAPAARAPRAGGRVGANGRRLLRRRQRPPRRALNRSAAEV